MDWKKTFNKGQWAVHVIFLVAIITGIGSTLFALRLNNLQSTETERSQKVNSLINDLSKDQSFEKVGKYLSWAETDKANGKMRELAQKLAETEELLEMKASSDVGHAMRTFNKLTNNAAGISSPSDALKVLKQKIAHLSEVGRSQNYRNVTIIAERMEDRLQQLNPKNVGGSIQVSYLKTDVKRLEQLVGSSSLSEGEKAPLLNRLTSMANELDLLTSLNSQGRDLKAHVTQASLALANWMIDVEKKAGDIQGMRFQKQNQLVLLLASLVGFLVLAWLALAYLFRWQKGKIGDQVEGEVKSVIEKGIMSDQRFMLDHYSDLTRNDIVRLLDELKVKLNLGTMLHDGLPFAGCMIDNNFKLTWHNHLFLEQLYLSEEEVKSDAFNWDYVRDYLNLDEDPIYQAMVNKIAGIFPVKVKQDELTPSQPYEMYVTPITVNREDRVMVFFYPLVSVKEAITEQVNLCRQSLTKFITAWNDDSLGEDELRILERDFKNRDLSDLYRTLSHVFERVTSEKDECIRAIHSLEKENDGLSVNLERVKVLETEKKEIIRQEFKLANDLRASFIQAIERSETLLNINRTVLQQNDDLKNEAQRLQQTGSEFMKKNRETVEIIGQLDGIKMDYKRLKLELLEVKAKLISINSTLFGQLPALDEPQQRLASRYKDELARLDFNVVTLDKKLSQLDVIIVKLQMMHDKHPPEQPQFSFGTSQKDHELRETMLEIQRALGSEESKIIDHFKSLHDLMKRDLTATNEAKDVGSASLDAFLS